jgi:hypothetical protein
MHAFMNVYHLEKSGVTRYSFPALCCYNRVLTVRNFKNCFTFEEFAILTSLVVKGNPQQKADRMFSFLSPSASSVN